MCACVCDRVERHAENIKTLKDLSIISDIIYCIHYCIDKLQKDIDTCSMKIESEYHSLHYTSL